MPLRLTVPADQGPTVAAILGSQMLGGSTCEAARSASTSQRRLILPIAAKPALLAFSATRQVGHAALGVRRPANGRIESSCPRAWAVMAVPARCCRWARNRQGSLEPAQQ